MPSDHASKCNVKIIKGSRGDMGLQHDKQLLQTWTVVSPELVRLVQEFEDGLFTPAEDKADSITEGVTSIQLNGTVDDILIKKHGSKVFQYLKSRTSILIDFSVPLMVYQYILAGTLTGTKYLLQDECDILVNTVFI